jgi:hypothetical protein
MKLGKKFILLWVIALFIITLTCSIAYLVTQQSLRLGANAVPALLAKDTAINLQDGQSPESSIPTKRIDASQSGDGFVMVFDKNKNLVATSGMMKTQVPQYPKGVLAYVAKNGEDRVTWQTQTGLRFASVAIQSKQYYIVGASSLTETENLIDHITKLVMYIWLVCFVGTSIAILVIFAVVKKYLTPKVA